MFFFVCQNCYLPHGILLLQKCRLSAGFTQKLAHSASRMLHYCLLSFLPLRIFLKEIENCIENPELLARCFLKRVSESFCRFVWISMVLFCSTYRFTPILSLWLLLWMTETHISRYSQIKPQLTSVYSEIWSFTWFTDRKRSVTGVLPTYFKAWLKKTNKPKNTTTDIQMFNMLFISDKSIPAVWCMPDTTLL